MHDDSNGDRTAKIRVLNDQLRQTHQGGQVMLSQGIAALEASEVAEILAKVAQFDDFSPANDPHQEHDCAAIEWQGQRVLFKVDYYDPTLTRHSDDEADPSITERVMAVMFSSEY